MASKTKSKAKAKHPSFWRKLLAAPGRFLRGMLRLLWGFTWRVGLVIALGLAATTAYYYTVLPAPDRLFDARGAGSVTMLDRHGDVFAWRGEQYGGELRAGEVSPHLVNAVIAAEDRRFYQHFGLDPRGIVRALVVNFRAGRLVQGGSTLTQQVAKNVFLDATRSLERKIKEVPMALALELKYAKEEILSVYLNRVYLGAGTYGFEAASQRYFGKSARVLDPAEAAMLAGLLRAPSRYAPTSDLSLAQGRASVIVRLMEEQGFLTEEQTIRALATPAVLSTAAAARAGGAFADWVMEEAPSYLTDQTSEDVLIKTTFDPEIQRAAEEALARVFDTKVREGSEAEAAIVVMSSDGAVRAIVGGRAHGQARFNRATQALRQTGSVFKPIVYAAALEDGMRPFDVVDDAPLTIRGWSPSNYTGRYLGPVTLHEALAKSINTVAVRVSERTGRDEVHRMAERLGLTTAIAPGPAVALGTSEAKLIEMTGVFATIANGGGRATPHGAREIGLRGDDRALISQTPRNAETVLSAETAGLLTHMLMGVVDEGTGRRAQLADWEVAGKTGTTQKARDAWFIGFTADYVAGVWMGYDDNRPLTGVTGGGLPAEIWRETMAAIHVDRTPRPLNIIAPRPAERIVMAPGSGKPGGPTLVERVFQDVLRGLGAGDDGGRRADFDPIGDSDRR